MQITVMQECISAFLKFGDENEMQVVLTGCRKYAGVKITDDEIKAVVKRERTLYERCQIIDKVYKAVVDQATGEQLFEIQKLMVGEKAYRILDLKDIE